MKMATITVTEAARNFADCLGRVRYQKTTFVLVKNGRAIARLVPEKEKSCTGEALAKILEEADLLEAEAQAWRKDLIAGKKRLIAPEDKWR
jgi:antitoxin (DNA-binding transcriptional repressor) of toxin-antitoxin stability system